MRMPNWLNRSKVMRKWRRWRDRRFLKGLRSDLLQLNDRLKRSYTRRERRRICHELLKDIKAAVETYFREDR